jgi:WD40 repeat protein
MPRDLDSTSRSSTCRYDGVREHVSSGKTSTSPNAWKYLLGAVLVLAAVIACYYPWRTRSAASSDWSLQGHALLVEAVTFSPNGRTLATCSWDYTVRLWDMTRWEDGHPPQPVILPHDTTRFVTAFSPDGSMLVSAGDRSLTVWSCRPEYERMLERAGESYHCASFSPDGRTLALGAEDSTIRLWDMPSARERGVLRDHSGTIRSIAFSPDGRSLVSASQQGRVVLWDLASGAERFTLVGEGTDPVGSVAFSPDGRTIGVVDLTYKIRDVLLLDAETGAVRSRLAGHRLGANALAFSPDGRYLATAGLDHSIKLWDLATSKELATRTDDVGWVKSIAFSHDGDAIAFSGHDEIVRFWYPRHQQSLAPGRDFVRGVGGDGESRSESESPVAGSDVRRTYSTVGRRS